MNGARRQFNWTEEAVAELKRRAAEGQSASQAARALGVSRNAALGKAHRLDPVVHFSGTAPMAGNSNHGREGRAASTRHVRCKPLLPPSSVPLKRTTPAVAEKMAADYRASPRRQTAFDPACAPEGALLVALLDLKPGQCRWPLYEDGPKLFCGGPVTTPDRHGQPETYCDHHLAQRRPQVPL